LTSLGRWGEDVQDERLEVHLETAARSFAFVAAIGRYSYLPLLKGCEGDADAFVRWLVGKKPGEGGLFPENVIRVPAPDSRDRSVNLEYLDEGLTALRSKAEDAYRTGGRLPRLYLFFAGHGFSRTENDACLYIQEAKLDGTRWNVDGAYIATWFQKTGWFEEVVLIMDCCRDRDYNAGEFAILGNLPSQNAGPTSRYIYVFATDVGKRAREVRIPPPEGEYRGILTYSFLEALRRPKIRDEHGFVTVAGLKKVIVELATELGGLGADPRGPQNWRSDDRFLYAGTSTSQVVFRIKGNISSREYRLTSPDLETTYILDAPQKYFAGLKPGIYELSMDGQSLGFIKLRAADMLSDDSGCSLIVEIDTDATPAVRYISCPDRQNEQSDD
jgi:hypothetical protein